METSDLTWITLDQLRQLGVYRNTPVLLAFSGGIDSSCLLAVLHQLYHQQEIGALCVAHVNHQLRGAESAGDEAFASQVAHTLGLPIYTASVDTQAESEQQKIGIEEAARDLRYRFFEEVLEQTGVKVVITAHTLNDQLETLLLNLVRGSGPRGLAAIPPTRKLQHGRIVRPWLQITRKVIEQYVSEHGVQYREDHTNRELEYTRNRVRHLVVPALEEAFESREIYKGISASISLARNSAHLIEEISTERFQSLQRQFPPGLIERHLVAFDLSGLRAENPVLYQSILERACRKLFGAHVSLHNEDLESVRQILDAGAGRTNLRAEIGLSVEGEFLVVERLEPARSYSIDLPVGNWVQTPAGMISCERRVGFQLPSSADMTLLPEVLVSEGLIIRNWEPGDRMTPFGMGGNSKLVSDLLNEAGVRGENLKRKMPVVVRKEDPSTILWLPGVRTSELARVERSCDATFLELRRR